VGVFFLILEDRGGKRITLKWEKKISMKILSCFIWGAVKPTKIQRQVKVVSPEINKIRASVTFIAGELSSSKHI